MKTIKKIITVIINGSDLETGKEYSIFTGHNK